MDPKEAELLAALRNGEFAFADFGCGSGGSIDFCQNRFKRGKGLGFDKKPVKIEACKEAGFPIVGQNVLELDFPDSCIQFASMLDFLEHLPTEEDAVKMLEVAKRMASDFIFIRHPSFEDTDYLAQFGLKIDWSDWNGHTNLMTVADFERVFADLGFTEYTVVPRTQLFDSSHPCIVPQSAPTDTVRYDEEKLGPKPLVYFTKPVWSQFEIFVKLNKDLSQSDWAEILKDSITNG
tara:strand:+ start:906 stop:1610 length:705 start_codon:yes stop_codon:yes gene_type:complete